MSAVSQARARRAQAAKHAKRNPSDPNVEQRVEDARRNLAAANLEQYIARIVADAPALTDEQMARLARLLQPSGTRS